MAGDSGKVEELVNQIAEFKVNHFLTMFAYCNFGFFNLQLTIDGLEKERDFYFGKLRDIEVMCQESEDGNAIIQRILDVLYATEVCSKYHFLYRVNQSLSLYFWGILK